MTLVVDIRCDGEKLVREFDAINLARCRLRAALLVADALERRLWPSVAHGSAASLAGRYRPNVEETLIVVSSAWRSLHADLQRSR